MRSWLIFVRVYVFEEEFFCLWDVEVVFSLIIESYILEFSI